MSEYDKIADRATHTPGPWTVNQHGLLRGNRYWIGHANLTPSYLCPPVEERLPNARLIAAAPCLLAALEGMQQANGCFDDCRWEYSGRHQ